MRTKTILNLVLKFQVDRAAVSTEKRAQADGIGKWKKKK